MTTKTQINVDLNQPYYSAKIIFEDTKQPILEKKYVQVTDVETKGPLEVTYKIKPVLLNNSNCAITALKAMFRECFNTLLGPRKVSKLILAIQRPSSSLSLYILVFLPSHLSSLPLESTLGPSLFILVPIQSC
mgnify:CR=1 FL=1